MKRQLLILILLSGAISGCATYATGRLFTEAPSSQDKKSTLYLFRPKTIEAINPIVKIDAKPFVRLTVMGYSYAYLSSGIHRITFDSGFLNGKFITEIEIKEGEDVYLEYSGNGSGHQLAQLSKEQALDVVKDYRYIEPLSIIF